MIESIPALNFLTWSYLMVIVYPWQKICLPKNLSHQKIVFEIIKLFHFSFQLKLNKISKSTCDRNETPSHFGRQFFTILKTLLQLETVSVTKINNLQQYLKQEHSQIRSLFKTGILCKKNSDIFWTGEPIRNWVLNWMLE